MLAAHRQIATEFGNQADRVVAEARERSQNQAEQRIPDTRQQRAQEALSYARDRNFEREAVTDERALFVNALRRGMGEVTYPEIRANFESRLADGEFRAVASQKHDTGHRFTTAASIEAEHEVIQTVRDGQGRSVQIMPAPEAIRLTDARPDLNSGQRTAIEQILTSHDWVQGLQGVAGTGKTTALDAIRQGAEQRGMWSKGLPRPPGRRTSFATRASLPTHCRASSRVASSRSQTIPHADTSIWWMNPRSHQPN